MSDHASLALDASMPSIHGTTLTPVPPGVREAVFLIEVVPADGRAAAVKLWIKLDTVEVWHRDHCSGVFVRDELRAWLANPQHGPALVVDEVAFSLDRMVDAAGRVAISLPDVLVWTIDPHSLTRL